MVIILKIPILGEFMQASHFSESFKELPYGLGEGKVFRCSMPCYKNDHPNIEQDLTILKIRKISHIVLLTPIEESFYMTETNLMDKYIEEGFTVIHFPIIEGEAPDSSEVSELLSQIIDESKQGKNIAIHCMGGTGRTGLITACLARKVFNITGNKAIEWVRHSIPNAVETRTQKDFVKNFIEQEHLSNFEKSLTLLPFAFEKGTIHRCIMPGYGRVKPDIQNDIKTLKSKEISHIVLLASDEECAHAAGVDLKKVYTEAGFKVRHLPIKDFGVPDHKDLCCLLEQVQKDVSEGGNIAVHCLGGRGRTGTFLACLARVSLQLPAPESITWVREFIPGAVESKTQVEYVADFIQDQSSSVFSKSLTLLPFGLKGNIYRSIMPCSLEGKKNAKLHLLRDILTLKTQNISHVVLLATEEECFKTLGLNLKAEYEKHGINVLNFPIPDGGIPGNSELVSLINDIFKLASTGKNLAIHCRGGTGRTGIIVACLAGCALKLTSKEAIQRARLFIAGAVQNSAQEKFIAHFLEGIAKQKSNQKK
jgi:protein-tyrosine phosphatase